MEWTNGMEDALLPDGWSEGEDLLAPQEPLPTTEDPQGAVPAAGDAPQAPPRTYHLKVNHEEKDVTLTEEEVVARLQKSYAFDAIRDRRGEQDFAAQVRHLQSLYPDFREMPDEVAQLAADGESLLTAYAVWQGREAQRAAQALREENQALKQNASAAARAPVKGVSGGSAHRGRMTDFERGLESW